MLFKTTKSTAEQINLIKKSNFLEVKVIKFTIKKSEFYRNQLLIIKYLENCSNTKTLHEIITALNSLFEEYIVL